MRFEEEIQQQRFRSAQLKAILNVMFTSSWWIGQTDRLLKPYGLSMQQYNILRILRGSHPKALTVLSIKGRMLDRTPNTTRLVDKLLEKQLVHRERCEQDRRVVYVGITEEGLLLMSELDEIIGAQEAGLQTLSDQEALQLSELLDKLRG